MTSPQIAGLLNDLIATAHDGEQGYAKASREVDELALKAALVEAAMRCREGARELEAFAREQGLEPASGGSLTGAIHRGWMGLRAAATFRDAGAVLAECERGEDYARGRRFAMALAEELPPDLREILSRQYQGVLQNHARVRDLRDRASGPAAHIRGLSR